MSQGSSDVRTAEPIAGRYEVLRELGGGGMAVVFEVRDTSNNQRLALKRPRLDGSQAHKNRSEELFAREYHTLVQLSHPRIVRVYDFAVDALGPYYTMELLDGGDLVSAMPIDYRRACAVASDICSALSLLHSRRIVHRDVSPRNIRCTGDGLAKLIDFGAMTHMGPSKELVGTPAYCAPELLNMHALDARTDLYSLGATLYYALTGHHPYPAREFASLPNAWRFAVTRPSELASEIPDALDALILDLLQLAPDARPSNAAEVMARLSAISGVQPDEQLVVAQSYLSTPVFIGRRREIARVNNKTMRVMRRRGAAVLIEGPRGCGRSRFLDTCLLNSKLSGATVLRADSADADTDYGAIRSLLLRLQRALPELTREFAEPLLPVLGQIVPELIAERAPQQAAADLTSLRPKLQSAVRELLLRVADRKPLLLAVDDLDAIDEPSVAVIGVLAQEVGRIPLLILATAATEARSTAVSAFKLFADAAGSVRLQHFTAEESEALLESVFGTSHALHALAARLHALSGGSPRDLMRLAQHLVDSGAARYDSGSWTLPAGADAGALPSSVTQVLSGRLSQLPAPALELARALSLCPERSFSFAECGLLSGKDSMAALLGDIEQLTEADVVRNQDGRVVLSDHAWASLLRAGLAPEHERELHRRIALCFEARGDDPFRRAQHLLRANEIDRALDGFVAHAIASRAATDRNPEAFHQLLLSLPRDWLATYDEVLQLLRERGRPKHEEYAILARLNGMFALKGVGYERMLQLMTYLKAACGLTDWENAAASLEPEVRLKLALGQAHARYMQTPEHERVIEPAAAIRELAEVVRTTMYIGALALDLSATQSVPSLRPFFPIAPALAVSELVVRAAQARLAGRLDRARDLYREVLDLLATPERTGLGPTHVEYTRMLVLNARGALEAASGIPACLEAAEHIERHPAMQSNAYLIRMIYQLWQGNVREAERCRKQFEIARVQNSAAQNFESVQLAWQVVAHAAMEDLTNLKRSLDEIAPLATRYPAFRAIHSFGEAEHHRIRGDASAAVDILERVLQAYGAGTHQNWTQFAAAHVRALDECGRSADAVEQGQKHLAQLERAELGESARFWVTLALISPLAKIDAPSAEQCAEAAIAHCEASGVTGLNLGLAHEARAYVAVQERDRASYEQHLTRCEQQFRKAANPALSVKLQELKREAQHRGLVVLSTSSDGAVRHMPITVLKSRLEACADAAERARTGLALLAEQCGAMEGHLYLIQHEAPAWVTSVGRREPDDTLHAMAREYILAEVQAAGLSTGASELSITTEWTTSGDSTYRPVLLSHYQGANHVITGVAVFAVVPERPFIHPAELASYVSSIVQESGDVAGMTVSED
jgi:Protein kinase domain/AAA ATPase domain